MPGGCILTVPPAAARGALERERMRRGGFPASRALGAHERERERERERACTGGKLVGSYAGEASLHCRAEIAGRGGGAARGNKRGGEGACTDGVRVH